MRTVLYTGNRSKVKTGNPRTVMVREVRTRTNFQPGDCIQHLQNSEFIDGTIWTNGLTGETYWTLVGGAATATLVLVFEATFHLIQTVTGTEAGTYLLVSERTLSNVSGDVVRLDFYIYDANNNLISYYEDTGVSNGTVEISHQFTSLVPVTRIEMDATLDSGSNVNISVPFVRLYSGPCAESIDYRLLEDSDFRLLEDGDFRLLE